MTLRAWITTMAGRLREALCPDLRELRQQLWHARQAILAGGIREGELRREWERECSDTDEILVALDLNPEECRTDGGSLFVPRVIDRLEKLQRDADRYRVFCRLSFESGGPLKVDIFKGGRYPWCRVVHPAQLNAVIDTIMREQKELRP